MRDTTQEVPRLDEDEIRDWLDSLDAVIDRHGLTATGRLLQELTRRAEHAGVQLPFTANSTSTWPSIPTHKTMALTGPWLVNRRVVAARVAAMVRKRGMLKILVH